MQCDSVVRYRGDYAATHNSCQTPGSLADDMAPSFYGFLCHLKGEWVYNLMDDFSCYWGDDGQDDSQPPSTLHEKQGTKAKQLDGAKDSDGCPSGPSTTIVDDPVYWELQDPRRQGGDEEQQPGFLVKYERQDVQEYVVGD